MKITYFQLAFSDQWNSERKEWIPRKDGTIVQISDGIKLLSGSILWEEDKTTSLYRVSVTLDDPHLASMICNNIITALNSKFREQAIQRSLLKVKYLKKELASTSLSDMKNVLYTMLQAENQKAMLANITKNAAFEVIDPAVSGSLIKSNRKTIVTLGVVSGEITWYICCFTLSFTTKIKITNSGNTVTNS